MRITLPCSELYDAISRLRSVCSSGGAQAGGSPMIKLSPGDGCCDFVGFAGEIDAFRCRCENVEVEEGGDTLLPVAKLFEISRNLGEKGKVSLNFVESDEGMRVDVTASDQKVHYSLAPAPAADFPEVSDEAFKNTISLPQSDLAYIFRMVSFAMATHDPRNYLNGVFLTHEGNKLCAVATNGHRLARSVVEVDQEPTGETGVILPRSLVLEFEKNARGGKKDDAVELCIGESQVKISFGKITIIGRALAGQYPDYKRVIPEASSVTTEAVVDREELSSALQKASAILINSPTKDQTVKLTFSKNNISIKTKSFEGDEAEVPAGAEYSGEEVTIGFNNQYITDVLKTLQTEKIVIQIQDAMTATRIVGKDGGNDDYVVMPLRL